MILQKPVWNLKVGLDRKNNPVGMDWSEGIHFIDITDKSCKRKVINILEKAIELMKSIKG